VGREFLRGRGNPWMCVCVIRDVVPLRIEAIIVKEEGEVEAARVKVTAALGNPPPPATTRRSRARRTPPCTRSVLVPDDS